MSVCLSDEELQAITRRVRPGAQIRALRAMGIEYRVRPDGTPMVLRSWIDETGDRASANDPEPNWDAL